MLLLFYFLKVIVRMCFDVVKCFCRVEFFVGESFWFRCLIGFKFNFFGKDFLWVVVCFLIERFVAFGSFCFCF